MDKMELLSYCVIKEDGRNTAYKIGSDEINNWKKRYIEDFFESYIDEKNKSLDVRQNYFDPDGAFYKSNNHRFYDDLIKFLKKSEDKLSDELEGKFDYDLEVNKGIRVTKKDKNGTAIQEFYLRSDQLGFSAPTNDKSHPYDLFIAKSQDKQKAVSQVCDWISRTRTIGGSFLWPMPFHVNYNPKRGGTVNSNKKYENYYIQDRVDLTLQEIQNWYLQDGEFDILNKWNTKDSNLDIWLQHFKNFDTYVKFFCFDGFLKNTEGEQKIKNIICESRDIPKINADGTKPPREITDANMDFEQLKEMLNRLSDLVIERSNKMINR